jgi:tetratricopeptide (TPR) repeat protein
VSGELPPPPPRVFFGRDELIEKIVHSAEHLTPIALIGAGGIGKTSIVLTTLHDDRIKQRFGDNRRFIRCDQFPASHVHLLRRLSKVIGAGVENPEDLTPLRRYLSSREMLIVLDNAESILDPQGTNAQEIYAVVDELTRFSNICVCITSRISTIPPGCETLEIPTLSIEAAHETFYRIYKRSEPSDPINDILEQLDFHPLSVTLLATVAQHSKWDTNRLTREWGRQRTGVLHAQHSGSLAATIELSLASPMFQELGPDARGLLGIIAFFPQGVNENNIDWLFPTISDGPNIFDKFCILSLTYQSNGFITMLAPLRDYLRPNDPKSSPLLSTTKECYFARLSANIFPGKPGFEESRWITSEDVNVEHLLDVFTSFGADSEDAWDTCSRFMSYLFWNKPRLVTLGSKIEALPDDHPSKPTCLWNLSRLFKSVGNNTERKRLLTHALKLWRERGDENQVARTLGDLSDTNREMGLLEEGIEQAKEASEISKRLGDTVNQAGHLINLAYVLRDDEQLDAAEEAIYRAIDLLPEKGEEFQVCNCHRVLGDVYRGKGESEKAIYHFEVALEIASTLNDRNELFWIHYALSELSSEEDRFNDAHAHIERAKSYADNDPYLLACASHLQASIWDRQNMFEEAKSEALRALDVFEKLGATDNAECTRALLGQIDDRARGNGSGESADDGEPLETMLPVVCINFVFRRDHRIRMMASTLDSSSLDVALSQVTNTSPLHPVFHRVLEYRYYTHTSLFFPRGNTPPPLFVLPPSLVYTVCYVTPSLVLYLLNIYISCGVRIIYKERSRRATL